MTGSDSKRAAQVATKNAPRSTRSVILVVLQLGLLTLVAVGPGVPGLPEGFDPDGVRGPVRLVTALALGVLGATMMLLGTLHLGGNLTPLPEPARNARLIEKGIYGWVRHPIYLGLLLAAIGWTLWTANSSRALFTLTLALLLDVKARHEESRLLERFDGYAAYRRRVRRWIPFVY